MDCKGMYTVIGSETIVAGCLSGHSKHSYVTALKYCNIFAYILEPFERFYKIFRTMFNIK